MRFLALNNSRITVSTLIYTGHGFVGSLLIGTDGTNDPVVTVYNALSAVSGTEIIPTTTYDASALGLNGLETSYLKECGIGCYVEISNLGTGEVVIGYRADDGTKIHFTRQPYSEDYVIEEK